MSSHLPIIQVLLPLFGAAFCLLIRHRLICHVFASLVGIGSVLVSLQLLAMAQVGGVEPYHLGGWAPPLGIEFQVNTFNAYVLVIVSMIAAVVIPFGLGYRDPCFPEKQEYLLFATILLCLTGLLGIAITGDAFNVFVFLEISSLSSYAIIAMGRSRRAIRAAFDYLLMGTIGGTFILIGIGMLYLVTGTLNMADIADRIQPVIGSRTVIVAFAFLTLGISMKLAVFPLHQWLPNAYAYAPTMVSAFLSATATKVQFYLLARVVYTVFGAAYVFGLLKMQILLLPLSLAAMFIGSMAAIYQTNIKKLFAYSSVAQIGYMTLGLSINTLDGLTGSILHLFNHALMKGGLFLVVACFAFSAKGNCIADLRGLGRKMPFTSAAFVIGGLSLIGVPGSVGFVSKWYLVIGALERDFLFVAGLILLSSLLAVVYIWRVIEVLFVQASDSEKVASEAPVSMLVPAWILIGSSIYFGIKASWSAEIAKAAANWLMGGGV